MSDIVKHLRTKQVAIICTGVVLAITAVTLWNWSAKDKAESPSDNEERSVKHKKSVKKDISDEANNQDQNQSQIKKQEEKPSIAVKEEKVVVAVEEKVETKETEANETHFDESSSTKSHCLSVATSSADESDICTPKQESNTNSATTTTTTTTTTPITTDAQMEVKRTTTMDDTQEREEKDQVKFDWTDESVTEALPVMNRDIVTSVESAEPVVAITATAAAVKDDFVVVDYPAISAAEPVAEPVTEKEAEKRPLSSSLTASAPEFVPKSLQQPQPQQKRHTKKFLTREQLIEQQRQHHMPRSKARCSHWPHCTNNNCKFFHPYRACRAGDECLFGDRCMFVHPNDCTVAVRENHQNNQSNSTSNSDSNAGSPSITAE